LEKGKKGSFLLGRKREPIQGKAIEIEEKERAKGQDILSIGQNEETTG